MFSTTQRTKSEVLIDFEFLNDVEGTLDEDGQPNQPTEHYCSHFFVAFLANSADNVLWWSSSPGLVDGLAWNMYRYLIMFVYASG